MQSNPQGFQAYCEAKTTIPVNPREPGWVKRKFYDAGHFPGVIGAIDCIHFRVICPNKENAIAFVNRKQFYSINVQAVSDSVAFITNIVARWPGSTHDSRIFENSNIKGWCSWWHSFGWQRLRLSSIFIDTNPQAKECRRSTLQYCT